MNFIFKLLDAAQTQPEVSPILLAALIAALVVSVVTLLGCVVVSIFSKKKKRFEIMEDSIELHDTVSLRPWTENPIVYVNGKEPNSSLIEESPMPKKAPGERSKITVTQSRAGKRYPGVQNPLSDDSSKRRIKVEERRIGRRIDSPLAKYEEAPNDIIRIADGDIPASSKITTESPYAVAKGVKVTENIAPARSEAKPAAGSVRVSEQYKTRRAIAAAAPAQPAPTPVFTTERSAVPVFSYIGAVQAPAYPSIKVSETYAQAPVDQAAMQRSATTKYVTSAPAQIDPAISPVASKGRTVAVSETYRKPASTAADPIFVRIGADKSDDVVLDQRYVVANAPSEGRNAPQIVVTETAARASETAAQTTAAARSETRSVGAPIVIKLAGDARGEAVAVTEAYPAKAENNAGKTRVETYTANEPTSISGAGKASRVVVTEAYKETETEYEVKRVPVSEAPAEAPKTAEATEDEVKVAPILPVQEIDDSEEDLFGSEQQPSENTSEAKPAEAEAAEPETQDESTEETANESEELVAPIIPAYEEAASEQATEQTAEQSTSANDTATETVVEKTVETAVEPDADAAEETGEAPTEETAEQAPEADNANAVDAALAVAAAAAAVGVATSANAEAEEAEAPEVEAETEAVPEEPETEADTGRKLRLGERPAAPIRDLPITAYMTAEEVDAEFGDDAAQSGSEADAEQEADESADDDPKDESEEDSDEKSDKKAKRRADKKRRRR